MWDTERTNCGRPHGLSDQVSKVLFITAPVHTKHGNIGIAPDYYRYMLSRELRLLCGVLLKNTTGGYKSLQILKDKKACTNSLLRLNSTCTTYIELLYICTRFRIDWWTNIQKIVDWTWTVDSGWHQISGTRHGYNTHYWIRIELPTLQFMITLNWALHIIWSHQSTRILRLPWAKLQPAIQI